MPDNTNVRFAIPGSIGQIVIGDIACEEDLGRLQEGAIRLRATLTTRDVHTTPVLKSWKVSWVPAS